MPFRSTTQEISRARPRESPGTHGVGLAKDARKTAIYQIDYLSDRLHL